MPKFTMPGGGGNIVHFASQHAQHGVLKNRFATSSAILEGTHAYRHVSNFKLWKSDLFLVRNVKDSPSLEMEIFASLQIVWRGRAA